MAEQDHEHLQLLPGVAAPDVQLPSYTILGRPAFAAASFDLLEDQTITADAGSLLWTESTTSVRTHLSGGPCDAYWRGCSEESCCFNTYQGPGNVTLGMPEPGDMLPFAITPEHGWVVTAQAYVAGTENLQVSSRFSGCMACLCSGEGAFLTRIRVNEGSGVFFAGGYGELVRHDIPEGKTLIVDSGLFFAAHESVDIAITWLGSFFGCLCGGEGLLMRFTGPGVVYTQSRDPRVFRRLMVPSVGIPSKAGQQQGGAGNAAAQGM